MATTFTRNLKLRINGNLTNDAKYNLEQIDLLGSTFIVDRNNDLRIRSSSDILIEPESADTGGSGVDGSVAVGSASHVLASIQLWGQQVFMMGPISLRDQASGGTKNLNIQYKSDASGGVDTVADRTLSVDLSGADRSLVLGGNVTTTGGDVSLASAGPSSVTLPGSGTLATLAGTETLTNKTIVASANTITGLTNANVAAGAGVEYSKLNLASSIVNADVAPAAAVAYSKLNLNASVLDSDIAPSAGIDRSKIASGSNNHVVINSSAGALTSEQYLSKQRGGTGGDSSSVTFPSSGTVTTDSGAAVLTNKSIDGLTNTLSNVPSSALDLDNFITDSHVNASASIAYSKLNLSGSIVNADVAAGASIQRSKLASGTSNEVLINDGSGVISSEANLAVSRGGTGAGNAPAALTNLLPSQSGNNGRVLQTNGTSASWAAVGTGSVTSVALSAPAEFLVSGSPITTSGTLAVTKADQTANTVWAGPASGPAAQPSFRTLSASDIPTIAHSALSGLSSDDHTQYHTDSRALTWLGTRSTSDLPEGTNQYFTDEKAQDAVGSILTDSSSVDFTYNDAGGSITAAVLPGGVDHDALLNFVANEHVDHTTVNIATAATSGLSGGGSIDSTRNIVVDPTAATSTSPAPGDVFLFADVSNSNALRRTTLQDILNLGKQTFTWAPADGTSKSITHTFATTDVSVTIFDIDSGEDILVDTITRASSSQIDLTSTQAPTGSGWRIIVRA